MNVTMTTRRRTFARGTLACGMVFLFSSGAIWAQWVAQFSPTKERLRGIERREFSGRLGQRESWDGPSDKRWGDHLAL